MFQHEFEIISLKNQKRMDEFNRKRNKEKSWKKKCNKEKANKKMQSLATIPCEKRMPLNIFVSSS